MRYKLVTIRPHRTTRAKRNGRKEPATAFSPKTLAEIAPPGLIQFFTAIHGGLSENNFSGEK
jgi:hypothetical protein